MKLLSITILCNNLLTIYKTFAHSHLDYVDIIYYKPGNVYFDSESERIQYNACLAISSAIQGTKRDSIYKELGLESPSARIWYRKLPNSTQAFPQPT